MQDDRLGMGAATQSPDRSGESEGEHRCQHHQPSSDSHQAPLRRPHRRPHCIVTHGYADGADTWRQLLALLSHAGRRAVAVDLPGFGRADRLGPQAILPQLDDYGAAVLRYAAGRSRQPVLAAGSSLGGLPGAAAGRATRLAAGRIGGRGAGRPGDAAAAVPAVSATVPEVSATVPQVEAPERLTHLVLRFAGQVAVAAV